ncbi:MAG: chromosome segregation ATPase [Desulforhopalus sp.]|jgi:chromosome segregation ATPase
MDRDTELQRLEQFVEKLLLNFAELKEQKSKLLQTLKERDSLIAELEGNISSKDSERTEISLRVGKLVEQIEDWELGLDDEEENNIDDAGASYNDEVVGDDEDAVKDEGRVQHDLFTAPGSNE